MGGYSLYLIKAIIDMSSSILECHLGAYSTLLFSNFFFAPPFIVGTKKYRLQKAKNTNSESVLTIEWAKAPGLKPRTPVSPKTLTMPLEHQVSCNYYLQKKNIAAHFDSLIINDLA